MTDGFKDFLIAVVVLALLVAYFSGYSGPWACPEPNGNWTINSDRAPRKGDTGQVIPGKGAEPATVWPDGVELGETGTETENSQDIKTDKKAPTEETEEQKMDGMIIAFWHGVAAVLIGEVSAILVALAWTKIKGARE